MIRIVTDSAADMENEELERYSVIRVPLTVSFGDRSFLDGEELSKDKFFDMLRSEADFPKTSQPSPDAFLKVFKEAKEAGEPVIAILVSGELSGTIQSAAIAKELSGHNEVYIIDSRLATGGEKMLVIHAALLRDKGYSAGETAEEVEKLRDRIRLVAGLDTLEYLCKGGRLSKAAAGVGTLVNIKPIIRLTDNGAVVLAEKCMGRKNMLGKLLKYPQKDEVDTSFPICFLYANDKTNCDALMSKMADVGYDISNSMCVNIGPAIGSHIGTGAVGMVYVVR